MGRTYASAERCKHALISGLVAFLSMAAISTPMHAVISSSPHREIFVTGVENSARPDRNVDLGLPHGFRLPMLFLGNIGQWDDDVRFGIVRGMDKVAFTREGLVLFRPQERPTLPSQAEMAWTTPAARGRRLMESSTLRFVNPSPRMRVEGMEESPVRTGIYKGRDRADWQEQVPAFRGIRYVNVWDGIDIEYVEHQGKLVQRIVASPAADLGHIAFETGNLTEVDLREPAESRDGTASAGELRLSGDTARVIPYRNFFEKRKVIETEFNSYFGGSGAERPRGIDIDDEGNILIALFTASVDMPVKNAFQATHHGGDVYEIDYYLARFTPYLVMSYGTFLGGTEDDWVLGTDTDLESDRMLAAGLDGAAHFLCNTASTDFPVKGNVLQSDVPPPTPITGIYCSLVRLDSTGKLDAATWLGNPNPFLGIAIDRSVDGKLFVLGACRGEQWFVTPGTVQDTFVSVQGDESLFSSLVVAHIGSRYDTVYAATYLLAVPGMYPRTNLVLVVGSDSQPVVVATAIDTLNRPPSIRSWKSPNNSKHDLLIAKLTSDLGNFIFTTWLGGYVELDDIRIDSGNNIILAGDVLSENLSLIRPIAIGPAPGFVMKFPPTGGDPIFCTRLPGNMRGSGYISGVVPLNCGDIAIVGTTCDSDLMYVNPMDTVLGREGSPYMIVLSPDGQHIRSSGYWQVDEKYLTQQRVHFGVGRRFNSSNGQFSYFAERNGNVTMLGYMSSGSADSITPLRGIQDRYAGGESDMFLVRTRIPGCELLTCSMEMSDSIVRPVWPRIVVPESFEISVDVRNFDPSRSARDIECVLTLPPGLLPDPASQPLRKSLGPRRLGPGESETFTWQVRIDTTALTGDGLWVDAMVYYQDADVGTDGAPKASPCSFYISIVRPRPAFTCRLDAPDTLDVDASGGRYSPSPFPVHFELTNDSDFPFPLSRVGLHFGNGMGVEPAPPASRFLSAGTLAPGASFQGDWQADATRLPSSRVVHITVMGQDEAGNLFPLCDGEIIIRPIDPLRCASLEESTVRFNPRTGLFDPVDALARLRLWHEIDTLLPDVTVTADLSACRVLELKPGETPQRSIPQMLRAVTHTLDWTLTAASGPAGDRVDTVRFHAAAGGGAWTRSCEQTFRIRVIDSHLECAIQLPASLSAAKVQSRTPVLLEYTLTNTGTVPVNVDRLELAMDPLDSGLDALDPITLPGAQIAAGATLPWYLRLRAAIWRETRSVHCTVTAYGQSSIGTDSVLSRCDAAIEIEGVDGLRCAITAADSVRFERDSLRYSPNPVPVTMDLSNVLDTDESAVEAEIDLTGAPRFKLAGGEDAKKVLAGIDSQSLGSFTWLLVPEAATTGDNQDIIIRYRSSEQGLWKECGASVFVAAWPEIAEVRCATAGHDSLFADAAYEAIVPEPFQVSYTATNSGTLPLTGCEAAIVLPPGFALAGSDSIQSFGTSVPGSLAPNESATRWWTLTTDDRLQNFGAKDITWQWSSDQQGSTNGCAHVVQVSPDPSSGIVLTPLRLFFEAELGGALPPAQPVRLWTGGGLSIPWTAVSDTWYMDIDPEAGDRPGEIAVRPNTTMLNKGLHTSTLTIGGAAGNLPRRIAVEYQITNLTDVGDRPSVRSIAFGPVYPHPIPLAGEARLRLRNPRMLPLRVTLHDLLGRERAILREGMTSENEVLYLRPAALGLSPGNYLLRVLSSDGQQSLLVTVVR